MQSISDQALVQQLREEHNASFELLYQFYFPSIAAYVQRHYGNTADAEDVFQESIIVLLQKIRQPDFVLSASLKTYLFAIAKNTWLKKLRYYKKAPTVLTEKHQPATEVFYFEIHPQKLPEEQLQSWLSKITANCQRILKAIFFYREPMEAVMTRLGWKNRHTAANQQYKCIQQVKKQKNREAGDN